MRKSTVRGLAILVVVLSLIITFTVKIIDNSNSSVDIDCKKYYYNQLEYSFEKDIYTKIENIKDFEIDDKDSRSKCAIFYVKICDIHFLVSHAAEEIKRCVVKAVQAAIYDMPLKTYFFHRYSLDISGFSILSWPFFLELKIKLNITDDYSEKTKEWYDQRIIHQMDNIPANIDESATIPDKIMEIHKYVIDTLNYDHDNRDINSSRKLHDNELYNIVNRVSSVYNALVGDHRVVCEGYAKMFKVLCDKYDVPCIIVTSDDIDDYGQHDGHMWNYVYIDNLWYIVDCTWDDGKDMGLTKVSTEYLMSGVDKYHQPSNEMNFKVPALSLNNYGNFATFMSGDVELFKTVSRHGIISEPPTPKETEKTFMYWYTDDEDKPFDFCSSIDTNIILKAKWIETCF